MGYRLLELRELNASIDERTMHSSVRSTVVVGVILVHFILFYFIFLTLYYPFREIRAATPGYLQQPQEQRYPVLQVHDGSFRVSVIHRTETWTTGSLTCVRDHSYE